MQIEIIRMPGSGAKKLFEALISKELLALALEPLF
jgi:hypothetical protein